MQISAVPWMAAGAPIHKNPQNRKPDLVGPEDETADDADPRGCAARPLPGRTDRRL